ncbi:pancreatic secretory granule membrane major glycoprotein GP2-like [Rhinatrema bivittatum]|uniref:pancreatic secretory granule membrane major glycoprotein GP2-like n=1 Tax=Rhinatrema bivittatum TaxID=194408 RepID=UPI00112B9B22|nr:pancreatic secretory granule membrane major glycoprotein GP2-like [Rhinatrema bivittatum]
MTPPCARQAGSGRREALSPEMHLLLGILLLAVLREAGAATCVTQTTNGVLLCSDPACAGGCDTNGCKCSNVDPCIPAPGSSCPADPSACCPAGLYWYPDLSCCAPELNCAPACLQDEFCANVSGSAVCQCNLTMHQNATINDLTPNMTCLSSVMILSISRCALEALHFNASSMYLTNTSTECTNVYQDTVNNISVYSMQVLPINQSCGTEAQISDVNVTYSNVLYIYSSFFNGLVFGSTLNLSFSCTYNRTFLASLANALHPVMNSVNLTIPGVPGTAETTIAAFVDAAYAVPLDSTQVLSVGSTVYIGLISQSVDGNIFALRIINAFATPTPNPNDPNKVDLITGGCPANQFVGVNVDTNGLSLEDRFSFKMLMFQNQPEVYIYCLVRLCDKTTETCTGCQTGRSAESGSMISLGIITSLADDFSFSSSSHTAVSWSLLLSSLLALLSFRLM